MRFRPALTRLLVLLLLLQWGTAFGHCLRMAAPEGVVHAEICTAEGLRTVTLPAEEGDAPDHRMAAPICPACLGPGVFALPAPEVALAPPVLLTRSVELPPPQASPLPALPRSSRPPPRAPPIS